MFKLIAVNKHTYEREQFFHSASPQISLFTATLPTWQIRAESQKFLHFSCALISHPLTAVPNHFWLRLMRKTNLKGCRRFSRPHKTITALHLLYTPRTDFCLSSAALKHILLSTDGQIWLSELPCLALKTEMAWEEFLPSTVHNHDYPTHVSHQI